MYVYELYDSTLVKLDRRTVSSQYRYRERESNKLVLSRIGNQGIIMRI